MEPRPGMSPGFTLMELLVATALIGVIALAAAAFSKDIFAVQHRLTTEYDLRMEGLRAMEEIREGFSSGGTRYGGVRQAEEVVVLAGGKGLSLTLDEATVVYRWMEQDGVVTRSLDGGAPQVYLGSVTDFGVSCDGGLIAIRLELTGRGRPAPRERFETQVLPRNAFPVCQ
ncbi:MAG: hypothetical protein CW345_08045 [Firmicutes bacterium]|nr:hypothetical protein [Bacillota bacterium]MBO2521739.1 hypothetical protein [Bacillota bacterium]